MALLHEKIAILASFIALFSFYLEDFHEHFDGLRFNNNKEYLTPSIEYITTSETSLYTQDVRS